MRTLLFSTLLLAALPSHAADVTWPALSGAPSGVSADGSADAVLIVGIENYTFLPDVAGAAQNAFDWEDYMRSRGVPGPNIQLLVDRPASRTPVSTNTSIRDAAKRAAASVGSGGTLWVVFIGHGAPSKNQRDGLLVGADATATAGGIYDRSVSRQELLDLVGTGRQAETVVVLDTCFSGQGTTGESLAPGLQPVLPTDLALSPAIELLATSTDEFAGSLPGLKRPAYSYLVLGGLRGWGDGSGGGAKDGRVTVGEAHSYASETLQMVLTTRTQAPTLRGSGTKVKVAGREGGPDRSALRRRYMGVETSGGGGSTTPRFNISLDVSGDLKEQSCVQTAQEQGAKQRASRLSDLEASARREAVGAWTGLKPQAEACLALEDRSRCVAAVGQWLELARGLEVRLDGGREAVQTECGERSWAFEEEKRRVAVSEVADAEGLLGRLKEAKGAAAGGGGVSGEFITSSSTGMKLMRIPGGTFTMGCTAGQKGLCYREEKPAHGVTLSGFYIGRTEVTQGEWQAVMGSNPSSFSSCGASCPVEEISWTDALAFTNKLSAKDGLTPCYRGTSWSLPSCDGYRLPTEAEWEYAARGGADTLYSGGDELDLMAWTRSNSGGKPHAVGQKSANGYGLHDMSGNVYERCWDWLADYPSGSASNPIGPTSGSGRVYRGGSWNDTSQCARVANRPNCPFAYRNNNLGLRLVRSAP